jgi:hypothetical protein
MHRRRWLPFVENTAESTVACMVAMTQANVLLVTTGHWIVAAQTGLLAGSATAALVVLSKARKRWVVATLLGVLTAVVDYWVHPGAFGPVFMEAAVTGVIAGALSFTVGWVWRAVRGREPEVAATVVSAAAGSGLV